MFKNLLPSKIRVRIAPSPTGQLHFGTARTALFNFLFARANNGVFLVRIEDTDVERSKKEFEKDILDNLTWLGISWDEEIIRQSERKKIYHPYIKKLLEKDLAYYCFCQAEDLEAIKAEQMSRGEAPRYSGHCQSIKPEIAQERITQGEKSIIRLRVPQKNIEFEDLVKGKITYDASLFGDFVIAKNEDEPIYNLAVVIDDFESRISHIIRGEDHISNTPKQIIIQKMLDFPRPHYIHLPLILNPDRSKMSKRKNITSIKDYREDGFLKEALINFIAFLGWNPKTNTEIFSLEKLITEFSIKGIQKAGAVFNLQKLEWFNNYYIKHLPLETLFELSKDYFQNCQDKEKIKKIISLQKDRVKKLSEFKTNSKFFFELPNYEGQLLIWKNSPNDLILNNLKKIKSEFEKINNSDFVFINLKKIIDGLVGESGSGEIYWPLRTALSGLKESPPPLEIAEIIGQKESLIRIEQAMELLKSELTG
ncbi:glutamate--tRNA ligase [Candidatus Azambacteria bacterium]|nr:glutamate--tRNA ligase [Candidatus Azambacteria bacterium]